MKTTLLLAILISTNTFAQQPMEQRIKACTYISGIAERIQTIRQEEHDDWVEFNRKAKKLYKFDAGLVRLLEIAETVYGYVPEDLPANQVFDFVFGKCELKPVQEFSL